MTHTYIRDEGAMTMELQASHAIKAEIPFIYLNKIKRQYRKQAMAVRELVQTALLPETEAYEFAVVRLLVVEKLFEVLNTRLFGVKNDPSNHGYIIAAVATLRAIYEDVSKVERLVEREKNILAQAAYKKR